MKPIIRRLSSAIARQTNETKICLAVAAGFFALGSVGAVANWCSPGCTQLDALWAVGLLYLFWALWGLRRTTLAAKSMAETIPMDIYLDPIRGGRARSRRRNDWVRV